MLFLMAFGCGMNEEDFHTSLASDLCAYAEACTETGSSGGLEAGCEDGVLALVDVYANDSSCTYDAAVAQECLDALATNDCEAVESNVALCESAYAGDACNLTLGDFFGE